MSQDQELYKPLSASRWCSFSNPMILRFFAGLLRPFEFIRWSAFAFRMDEPQAQAKGPVPIPRGD
jgi:hypothetical protein